MVAVVAEDGGGGSFVGGCGWLASSSLVFIWGWGCWYMGTPQLVHLCCCPVVCHIGGNKVVPGKREVRARGLLN